MEGGEKIEGNGKEIKKECGGRLEWVYSVRVLNNQSLF